MHGMHSRFLKRFLLLSTACLFAAGGHCVRADDAKDSEAKATTENPYPGRFPAPSLDGGVEWMNTRGEISLKELRGKVVILDFWTYCCINCIHILPDLKYLEKKYPNQLVVIGVHAAKFDNEKDSENIRQAIQRYEIEHPVVNDADMKIARKYFFNSWPTLCVIDPEGNFVGRVSGEGHRELLDHVVGSLVSFHREKGTLDETPIRFDLERHRAKPGPLKYPGKLLVDEAGGRLFISDSNHNRLVIASLDGKLIDIIGSGVMGAKDGSYAVAQFDHPQGMTLVGETLYVADTENHLIRSVDLKSRTVSTLAGTGKQAQLRIPLGSIDELPLNSPWALTHLEGTLYIAMAGPHQLWSHKLGSKLIQAFAGSGREDILDGSLESSALAQPSGITHDGTSLYHVDSEGSAVRQVTLGEKGSVTTVVGPHDLPRGRSLFEFGDVDGTGDHVRMQHPLGIVYHQGGLFVADTYNHKIKWVDLKTRTAETWLGTGTRGQKLEPVELSEPAGLAIARGKLWIADTNNHRILTADLKSKQVSEFIVRGLKPPARPQETAPGDSIEAVKLPAQQVGVGEIAVELQFDLPEGYKLNSLSNVLWKIEAVGDQAILPEKALGQRQAVQGKEKSAILSLPVTAAGQGVFDLSIQYQYCRDGKGGVCKLGRTKLRIPLTAETDEKKKTLTFRIVP